jgi:hypothetical protein
MKKFLEVVAFVGSVASIVSVIVIRDDIMKAINLFLGNLDFWSSALVVSLFITVVSFCIWRFLVNKDRNKKISFSTKIAMCSNSPVEILKDGEKHYMVKDGICSHIPDQPTFNYLGAFFGFSWGDAKLMSFDDIQKKFIMGKHLSSIRSYCSEQDIKNSK